MHLIERYVGIRHLRLPGTQHEAEHSFDGLALHCRCNNLLKGGDGMPIEQPNLERIEYVGSVSS